VLENIVLHNRTSQMNLADGEYELSTVKTLGILWDATTDVFTFKSLKSSFQQNVPKGNSNII